MTALAKVLPLGLDPGAGAAAEVAVPAGDGRDASSPLDRSDIPAAVPIAPAGASRYRPTGRPLGRPRIEEADPRLNFKHRFWRCLLRLMAERRLTQADVGAICAVEPQTVSNWIYERNECGGYALGQLALAFGPDFLLEVIGRKPLPGAT